MQPSDIIRSDDLRNENRRRLLGTLRASGPCSPAKLKQLTGLSAASISTLSSQMIEQGILLSGKPSNQPKKSQRGRPRTQLSLNGSAGHVLLIHLAIDRVRATVIDYAGTRYNTRELSLDTRRLSAEELLTALCQCIDNAISQQTTSTLTIHHISVAFQGQTEHQSGTLLWSPIIGERNVPLGRTLRERYSTGVSINNDCRLTSEALIHNHRNTLGDTFACVLFAHGIGLGLHLNGQPFSGTRSSALEMGHLQFEPQGSLCRCGKRGCIEAYAADYGISRMAKGRSIEDTPAGRVDKHSMDTLIEAAEAGDKPAIQAFTIAGAAVGQGLVTLFTLLDPMPVALVGHSDRAYALIRSGIHSILRTHLGAAIDPSDLLHNFCDDISLLDQGQAIHSLSHVDHLFAEQQAINLNT